MDYVLCNKQTVTVVTPDVQETSLQQWTLTSTYGCVTEDDTGCTLSVAGLKKRTPPNDTPPEVCVVGGMVTGNDEIDHGGRLSRQPMGVSVSVTLAAH